MKRTQTEIDAEIAVLEQLKPKVPRYTAFGDDNHKRIEAQLKVLRTHMDEAEAYREWEDPEDYEKNRELINDALAAIEWRDGESDDKPSVPDGWGGLAKGRSST